MGDKKILRDAARHLGLEQGAELVKRAIQFGSLASKQTSVEYFGSRRKGKGTSKIAQSSAGERNSAEEVCMKDLDVYES